jgi:hypothetical protein
VLFIVFDVVGNAIAGSPPKTSADAIKVASWFEAHHRDVVASSVFTSIAAPLFLLLLAGLALRLRAHVDGFLTARSLWFAAALGLITACAAWGRLPQWYAIGSLVVGVLLVIGGLSLRSRGFFSPLNGMTLIAFVALLASTLATAWVIWRGEEQVAATAVTA